MRIDSTNKMFQAEGTVSAKLENAAIIQVKNFSSLGLISWVQDCISKILECKQQKLDWIRKISELSLLMGKPENEAQKIGQNQGKQAGPRKHS